MDSTLGVEKAIGINKYKQQHELTLPGDVELDRGGHAVAGAAGVVALVPLAGVAEGELALGGLGGGGVGGHLDPPLHVVVDHPVVVVPEDVLRGAGRRVQHAGQGDGRALVHVVLLPALETRATRAARYTRPGLCYAP